MKIRTRIVTLGGILKEYGLPIPPARTWCVKIRTEYIYPPIPVRDLDWRATDENYDLGSPIGYGRTETDAIADLLAQIEDSVS